MVDDASYNGGPQGRTLAHPKTDKQLRSIEDDGVDATPLLEEGAGYCQNQLWPILASHDCPPRVLDLYFIQELKEGDIAVVLHIPAALMMALSRVYCIAGQNVCALQSRCH